MDGWETSYGWDCSCGSTSFITFTHQDSAEEGLRKHLSTAEGEHTGRLVELHTEVIDGPDYGDEDDYDDEGDWS
ncbi:hypothetical protein F4560_008718 [Saccharothrix ecbatanensis]|uniref:Uncharacterized protein n=1 Tax=Saccharothrix ecbatanensis TaxID=1105145 RepID=A0A7W9HUZ5_9PSEU|nr:hypothetical protein [Saccharothrix ecbatanensis]MBB5808950.1 hypothetical protein [Saccharothrix ecbatanensis]